MKKSLLLPLFLMALILGCTNTNNNQAGFDAVLKGVSLSPKSYVAEDFINFFFRAEESGSVLMWAGDWIELNDSADTTAQLAVNHNMIPLVEVQFFDQSVGELIRPLDETNKELYTQLAVDYAEKFKPEYLGLGIEVNVLFEESPGDFNNFVEFFSEVYDEIKAASPDTKVFTVFQLERMKGLRGGLFGGMNNLNNNDWGLIALFPKADLIAFTTYPGLIYTNPEDIPSNYYAEILSHTDKPIAFTEIGWHSSAYPFGWVSSEEEQAEFVSIFFNLTQTIDPDIMIWSFLYDQDVLEPFDSMGLYYSNGTAKQALEVWNNY
jgi:hypothetical protein